METLTRLTHYATQRAEQSRQALVEVSLGNPLLTPRQKRRLRHKGFSEKTHSHEQLAEVEIAPGKTRRVPCPKCRPPKQKLRFRLGGDQ